MLFHKYGGMNISVKNCMSHFSMFVSINSTVKSANVNTIHSQVIGIILFCFTNFPIMYPVVPVYYCPGHPSNTISSGALKFYVVFQKVESEPLEHCDFVGPQGCSWISPYQTQKNLDCLQINIFKVNPHRDSNIFVPTFCALSKQNIYQIIHHRFGRVSITGLKQMARRGIMEGIPENIPYLEEPCPIFSLYQVS